MARKQLRLETFFDYVRGANEETSDESRRDSKKKATFNKKITRDLKLRFHRNR